MPPLGVRVAGVLAVEGLGDCMLVAGVVVVDRGAGRLWELAVFHLGALNWVPVRRMVMPGGAPSWLKLGRLGR
jgi:hypothetical protein